MTKRTVWTYYGVVIFRSTEPGYRLPYTARSSKGDPLAADTLEEIKLAIRRAEGKERKRR